MIRTAVVRYWAVIDFTQLDNLNKSAKGALTNLLDDSFAFSTNCRCRKLCYNVLAEAIETLGMVV